MRRLAAPMIGGLGVSFVMELLLYPVIFYLAKRVVLAGTCCIRWCGNERSEPAGVA